MTDGRHPPARVRLTVNGALQEADERPGETLLGFLRNRLGLSGTKEACGRGECGACTVLVDGRATMSCIMLASEARGPVTTIEGLAHDAADLRRGFADHYAFQCGFCTSGQIVRAHDLLTRATELNRSAVAAAMSGNICRCTGYAQIVDAVLAAARERGVGLEIELEEVHA
jgi:aerobic-type carbon monoxide dehydrogenase small subunit (CoxS/CutS family)